MGDEVPETEIAGGPVPPDGVPVPLIPKLGLPKRSTPSLAADMMADPSMDGSKREDDPPIDAAADVLKFPSPKPWDTEPDDEDVGGWRVFKIGLFCWRFGA